VQQLLDAGADARGGDADTPLALAREAENPMLESLLTRGARVRSVDEALGALAAAGIEIPPGMDAELRAHGATTTYLDALHAIAASDSVTNLRWLDFECICGDGDYAEIAMMVDELSGGQLGLEGFDDHVAPDDTWLDVRIDGRTHRLELEWQNDWLDGQVLVDLGGLLRSRGPRILAGIEAGGQGVLLACITTAQLGELSSLPGVVADALGD